jgi:hypothetical protein
MNWLLTYSVDTKPRRRLFQRKQHFDSGAPVPRPDLHLTSELPHSFTHSADPDTRGGLFVHAEWHRHSSSRVFHFQPELVG